MTGVGSHAWGSHSNGKKKVAHQNDCELYLTWCEDTKMRKTCDSVSHEHTSLVERMSAQHALGMGSPTKDALHLLF